MANRLTRDEIILRALNHLDSPRLDEKCRGGSAGPGGTVTDPSLMTQWLQDGIDLAHTLYPLRGLLKSTTVALVAGTGEYALPTDYVTHYPDGVILNDATTGRLLLRLQRRGMSKVLEVGTTEQDRDMPRFFTVSGATNMWQVRPIPDKGYTAIFHYYALPAVLGPTGVPRFPNDYLLVEYLVARAKEWLRELQAGTANMALRDAMAGLVKAGIDQEAEDDQIPVDREAFPGSREGWGAADSWMGEVGV